MPLYHNQPSDINGTASGDCCFVCLTAVGPSNISSSSSTRSNADTAASSPAVNPSDTSINGSPVVAVGTPMATVSAAATGYQNVVMVSKQKMRIEEFFENLHVSRSNPSLLSTRCILQHLQLGSSLRTSICLFQTQIFFLKHIKAHSASC